VVYSRSDCAYCDDLRDRVLPEAVRGIAAEIAWRPAAEAEFVTRTPTLVVSRGSDFQVFEGLPPPEALRAGLLAVNGGHP